MSSDKRALDELDALFRDIPAKTVSTSSWSASKLRHGGKASPPSNVVKAQKGAKRKRGGEAVGHPQSAAELPSTASATAGASKQLLYTRLRPRLLPRGLRGAPPAPRNNNGAVGAAAATRLTNFVRGVLGSRGDRAATFAIESRMQRKVVHLENVSAQTDAQGAAARAARVTGRVRKGLSGRQCKKKGLNALKARDGGKLSFKHMLGVHALWKGYAGRLVAQCGSNQKLLQQRILVADLQGCYLTISRASASSLVNVTGIVLRETANTFELVTPAEKTKRIPKEGCTFRLAFGGLVIDLAGRVLQSRRAGQGSRAKRKNDREAFPLQTAAL